MTLCRTLQSSLAAMMAAASVALAGIAGYTPAQAATSNGSVSFQVTPDHAGYARLSNFSLPVSVRWTATLGGTVSYPVIADGKVFVVDNGSPSMLYALDASTGHVVWKQPSPSGFGPWIGAAYEDGRVFVVPTSASFSDAGAMFAFSASDGHQLWSAPLPGQYSFSSAPTARDGLVYTSGAGSGGTVYAVRETDGSLVWTGSVENGDSSAPAVTSDSAYVSYVCPQTYRFNASSGVPVWHYAGPCEGGGGESAAVYRGVVYVRDVYGYSTDGIALSARTGALVGGFNSQYAPAFLDGTAFLTEPATLNAVDIASGKTRWTAVPRSGQTFSCAPIVVNDIVVAATNTGDLYGFHAADGKTLYHVTLPQPVSCGEYFATPLVGLGAGYGLVFVPAANMLIALQ